MKRHSPKVPLESAGALAWTLLFHSCLRDGRLTSGMVSIGQCGPRNHWDAFSRERKTDPGGGRSASRISNTCSSTDLGGGGMAAPTRTNKPAWVSPVVNPRHTGWSPSKQSYLPLGRHQAPQPPESFGRAGWKPHLPVWPPMEEIDPAIKDIRIVSERGLTPPLTQASGIRRDMRKMRPAGQGRRFPGRPGGGVRLNNVMTEGVAVAHNSSAMVSEEVDVSVTPPPPPVG